VGGGAVGVCRGVLDGGVETIETYLLLLRFE
jgi:hypothetical protein